VAAAGPAGQPGEEVFDVVALQAGERGQVGVAVGEELAEGGQVVADRDDRSGS